MTLDWVKAMKIAVIVLMATLVFIVASSVVNMYSNIPSQDHCDKLYDKYEGTLQPTGYPVSQSSANDFCEYNDTYGGLWFNKTRYVETFQRAV